VRRTVAALLLAAALVAASAAPASASSVYAKVDATEVVLGNSVAERRWSRMAFRTTALSDKRGRNFRWSAGSRDFAIGTADDVSIGSEAFTVTRVDQQALDGGGLRLTMTLTGVPGLAVTRIAEAYPGVAGFRTQTILEPEAGIVLGHAVLEEIAPGAVTPTLHAFRAGADWREPEWTGPDLQVGDPHPGTWRDTRTAATGEPISGPGQWLAVRNENHRRSAFLVSEGTDFPSSRARYDGTTAELRNG
jgi:hypothetical protein